MSREVLPEVPEEERSQTSNLNIPLPTTRQVPVEPITLTSSHFRRVSQQSQRSDTQEHTSSQKHLACSQGGDPAARHIKQNSADLGKKLSSSSLGSTEGEQDRNILLGMAMQSLTQSKLHATSYQPRSLYSSKLSTTSSNGSSDSAYATGLSSVNHDECQSPPAAIGSRRRSTDEGSRRYSSPGSHSSSGSPDQNGGREEGVEWEVSLSNHAHNIIHTVHCAVSYVCYIIVVFC